jgi:hypothetical protein
MMECYIDFWNEKRHKYLRKLDSGCGNILLSFERGSMLKIEIIIIVFRQYAIDTENNKMYPYQKHIPMHHCLAANFGSFVG